VSGSAISLVVRTWTAGTASGAVVSNEAMINLRTLRRIAARIALAVALLVVALFVFVQAQQWITRWRAERLMADMHRIRLYQTTWAEAQELMRKWGAWGHWDGKCTAEDCEYAIVVGDGLWGLRGDKGLGWFERVLILPRGYGLFGGRLAGLRAGFTVHNGTIWRLSEKIVVDVPPGLFSLGQPNMDYGLLVDVKSRQQLNRETHGDRILGGMEGLAEHPYFVAGSPGGCENCLAGEVTYSTRAPQWQIDELSEFNLSCFTQFRACKLLPELYPADSHWQEMGWMFDFGRPRKAKVPSAADCDIPVWALGRDFNSVSEVEAIAAESVRDERYGDPQLMEKVSVKVLSTLKGSRRMEGLTVEAFPFAGDTDRLEYEIPEHMRAGQRYLLLWQDQKGDPAVPPGFALERCGVQPDTPEVREELKKGIAMNDEYRDHWSY